jgi:Retrotransposon gag protein
MEKFIHQFNIYQWMNRNHPSILDPLSQVAVFVNLIRGPDIEDWGRQALQRTNDRVLSGAYTATDEQLWHLLSGEFQAQFKDPALRENAQQKLNKLQMTSDVAVDDYIAKFNVLISELRWQCQTDGAIDAFRAGLKQWLIYRILNREQAPANNDLAGWQAAAQIEATKNMRKRQSGGRFAKGNLTARETLFHEFMQQRGRNRKNGGKKERDPDAMDVDTVETNVVKRQGFNSLTPAERKKLSAEGRCFNCKKQGHMA